jgi:hypothetical protein
LTCVARSCFDVVLMRGRPALFVLLSACAGLWHTEIVQAQARGDASLASLLRPVPVRPDDTDQLAELLNELAARPHADAAVAEIAAARQVLADLKEMQARASSHARIERRRQTLWAALLVVDRLEARAAYESALRVLGARVARAEADLAQARSQDAQAATLRESAP